MTRPLTSMIDLTSVIVAAAEARRQSILDADEAKAQTLAAGNRAFVDVVRPLVDAKALTVPEVAEASGINRARVYALMRLFPAEGGRT